MPLEPSPVVVTGMDRSGTSLIASLPVAAGVSMGDHLLAPDRPNPGGYFEDLEFLELDRRMLQAATPPADGGHPDWGWTESERLDREGFAAHAPQARALLAARAGGGRRWGWKDPRTAVALDFWDRLLPEEARFLFAYRFPWCVAASMRPLGAEVFLLHPEYAYRIWAFYNRQLLGFRQRRPERCLLVSTNALFHRPERFRELLRER